MKDSRKRKHANRLSSPGIKLSAFTGLCALYVYYMQASVWSERDTVGNITIYILSVFLFFAVAFLTAFLLRAAEKRGSMRIPEKLTRAASLLMLIPGGWFLVRCYHNEIDAIGIPGQFLRHRMPGPQYALILLAACALTFALIAFTSRARNRHKVGRTLTALSAALLQGCFLCTLNPFEGTNVSYYHIDAYATPVFTAAANTPFEMYANSIYGHYGLLFYIPVRALHALGMSPWNACAVMIPVFGFITFFCAYRVFDRLLENDLVYLLAILALSAVSFQIYSDHPYYQVLPHRYLFQSIILYGCLLAYEKTESRFIRPALWIMCGLAMLWNTETGLVLTAVWCLAAIFLDARKNHSFKAAILFRNALYAFLTFLGGYAFVNVYNLLVGGNPISPATYLYPLGSRTYAIETLKLTLMRPDNGYFLLIALMLATIFVYLKNALCLDMDEKQFAAFLAAAAGLGVFTYYMNRAVSSNASIASFSFVLILAHLCDRFIPEMLREMRGTAGLGAKLARVLRVRRVIGLFCAVVLTGLALASAASFRSALQRRNETNWNMPPLVSFLEKAEDTIPEGTAAFGHYTAVLYALLNRDPEIHLADFEDIGESQYSGIVINPDAFDKLRQQLEENNYRYILACADDAYLLPEGRYSLVSSLDYSDGIAFGLYERIP